MNVKQKTALLLAVFYMAAVTGLAFNLHFCGGKLDSLALFKEAASCKMCSKMEVLKKENTCCKDTKIEVKVNDNHQGSAKTELSKNYGYALAAPAYPVSMHTATGATIIYPQPHAPPALNQPAIHILHCTFRI